MSTGTERLPSRRSLRSFVVFVLLASLPAGGGYAVFWRYHLKRFQVVAPGTFYRVAQPTEVGLEHLVRRQGIRTVVSLQLFDPRLHRGWYDFDRPDGAKESEFVRSLGAKAVQWPMGDETCWPWPNAWEFEEFFHLVDDPANHPIVIHCMGGRHRTGTFAALYRMEYDRWTADRAVQEMLSFSFGETIPLHETNLRTYCPRPLPNEVTWPAVAKAFDLPVTSIPARVVPQLVDRIRQANSDDPLRRTFDAFVRSEHAYSLPLAGRVVSDAHDPLLPELLARARQILGDSTTDAQQAEAAAALIADFGSPDDQEALLRTVSRETRADRPSEFYEGLVCGITNRYTSNRLPYLRPLLDDGRSRLEPYAGSTYRETAVCRIAGISDALPAISWSKEELEAAAIKAVTKWLDDNPQAEKLVQLTAPGGRRKVLEGDGPDKEDLSKLRR